MLKSLFLSILLCSSIFAGETTEIRKEIMVKTEQELFDLLKVYMADGYTSLAIMEPWSHDKKDGWKFVVVARKYIK